MEVEVVAEVPFMRFVVLAFEAMVFVAFPEKTSVLKAEEPVSVPERVCGVFSGNVVVPLLCVYVPLFV